MRKEDVLGLIMYFIIFAVAVVFGLTILHPHFEKSTFNLGIVYALFILGAIISSIGVCAILFELGHISGAKIGGYSILSVCILHLMFFKEDDKFKVKISSFDGLTGETKILPKSEKSNPSAYLLMGTLFTSLYAILCIALFYVNKDISGFSGDVAYFFLTSGVVALICLMYNIVPFKMDVLNDGYRLAMTSNPRNREAFNELLRVEYEIKSGKENVEIKTFTELTNFTADLNMNKVYIALDKGNYEEALELIEIVLNNEKSISRRVYLRGLAMKIFLLFLCKDRAEAASFVENNITMELRKEIAGDSRSLISIRAYLLVEGLVDNSKSECVLVLRNAYKAYKNTPKDRRQIESGYFNKVLEILNEAHPKWGMLDYQLLIEDKKKGSEQ